MTSPTYRVEVYCSRNVAVKPGWYLDGASTELDLTAAEKRAAYCNRGEWPGDTRIVCEETGTVVREYNDER